MLCWEAVDCIKHSTQAHLEWGYHAWLDVCLAESAQEAEGPAVGEVEADPKAAASHFVEVRVARSVSTTSAEALSLVSAGAYC